MTTTTSPSVDVPDASRAVELRPRPANWLDHLEQPSVPLPPQAASARLPAVAEPRQVDPVRLRENLRQAIDEINHKLISGGRNLGIYMDEVLNTPVVKVMNTQTGEVVRQIPSEAVLKVAHTLEELKGLLHDSTS
jgi:flagellar protein FlaG